MNDKTEDKIKKLDERRADILYTLCENEKVWHPEILVGLVHEVRSITKVLKILRNE